MKKYQLIYETLKNQILLEVFPDASLLPTEEELAKNFNVSRSTIRKSLQLLQSEGLITTKQGSGSLVHKNQAVDFPISTLSSYTEVAKKLNLITKTNIITLDKLIITPELSNLTGFSPHEVVWRIIRQRAIDHVNAVLDTDYLLTKYVPFINKNIAIKSIYSYLEKELQLDIAYAKKTITIKHTTTLDKKYIDLINDQQIVSVQSKVFLKNGHQFQFTDSHHKLDKFRFVDFAYRHKDNLISKDNSQDRML